MRQVDSFDAAALIAQVRTLVASVDDVNITLRKIAEMLSGSSTAANGHQAEAEKEARMVWRRARRQRWTKSELADLPQRVRGALDYEKITTVDELCDMSALDVLSLHNIGALSLKQIREFLSARGKCLRDDEKENIEDGH